MFLLAEITPPAEFAAWMACAAFFVVFTNGAMKLVDRARGKVSLPPNEQLLQSHLALERRVETLETDFKKLGKEVVEMERRILTAGEERIEHIDRRLDALAKEFGDATRALPGQIVALLKNTGAI